MMVGDDQFQAQLAGPVRLRPRCDAAIDGDDHLRPALGQRAQRLAVQAVAFVDAMRHVVADFGREHACRHRYNNGRAAHAVDVVVAVDHDPAAGGDGRP